MRVTAGGRVVPNDLPPIGAPRYHVNSSNMQDSKNFQGQPPNANSTGVGSGSAQLPNGMVAYNAASELCQVVENQLIPLKFVNGVCQFIVPPTQTQSGSTVTPIVPLQPFQVIFPEKLAENAKNLPALEEWYVTMSNLNKNLERVEVIHEATQPPEWKAQVIAIRKRNIVELDKARKLLKKLNESEDSKTPETAILETKKPNANTTKKIPAETGALEYPQNRMGQQFVGQAFNYSLNPTVPPNFAYQPHCQMPFNPILPVGAPFQSNFGPPGQFNSTYASYPAASVEGMHYPPWNNSSERRSHAVKIKDPRGNEKGRGRNASNLNPASPVYEPCKPPTESGASTRMFVPPSPSPIPSPKCSDEMKAQHPWLFESNTEREPGSPKSERAQRQGTSSTNSVSTTDFFPRNTHEHSNKKGLPPQHEFTADRSQTTRASASNPITPQKPLLTQSQMSNNPTPLKENMHLTTTPRSPLENRYSPWNKNGSYPVLSAGNGFGNLALMPNQISSKSGEAAFTDRSTESHPTSQGLTSGYASSQAAPGSNMISAGFFEGYRAARGGKGCLRHDQSDYVQGYCVGLQENCKAAIEANRQPSLATTISGDSTQSFGLSPPDSAISLPMNSASNQLSFGLNNAVPVPPAMNSAPAEVTTFQFNPDASIWGVPTRKSILKGQGASNIMPNPFDGRRASVPNMQGGRNRLNEKVANENLGFKERKSLPNARDSAKIANSGSGFSQAMLPKQLANKQVGSSGALVPFSNKNKLVTKTAEPSRGIQSPSPRKVTRFEPTQLSQCDGAADDLADNLAGLDMQEKNAEHASSPSKKASTSPAKAKLGQMVKFGKSSKGKKQAAESGEGEGKDPERMTPQGKKKFRDMWGKRFQEMKDEERGEVEKYRKENPIGKA